MTCHKQKVKAPNACDWRKRRLPPSIQASSSGTITWSHVYTFRVWSVSSSAAPMIASTRDTAAASALRSRQANHVRTHGD
ncbi:hypothetical protein SNOG_14981 [Parastagonospora nodorum SN15]|uniref:Uncharacterized protein n=1 Tax=Phaeosphaeria nodorum (strain SN15 / ATCC MYA-4574 / FGSC 10173) TaxID=321614 RepID=Q0TZH4_PHANO|nr:hypothetical protein SNOG_14981 [Parastagonospora nodorum SN15]EAT77524.1 hypothetical protein SNOG_14981 [Parastagonospora nodorum SN15]